MSTTAKNRILKILQHHQDWLSPSDIDRLASIHRLTYTSRLLSELLKENQIIQKREGRQLFYKQNSAVIFLEETLDLSESTESDVFQIARTSPDYPKLVPEKISTIFEFSFTEMLNNAIDHSRSRVGYVKIYAEQGTLKFIVRDYGIGVFRNLMYSRSFSNEAETIQELLKGKLTSQPRRHSGEGIFWTSKMSDRFTLKSFDYALHINNLIDDYSIEHLATDDQILGTEVTFEISLTSQKSITDIFSKYSLSHETYSFNTTEIPLRLYTDGDFWVSRSQAKRVLSGLDKYQKVIVDFKGINLIGQGFADEIFRVFQIAHPNIIIEPINMDDSVRLMVERVLADPTGRPNVQETPH